MKITTYDAYTRLSTLEINRLTNFLHEHLEGYNAPKKAIRRAIQYSAKEIPGFGGYVFVAEEEGKILGMVVINKTGMGDYIPENFLVYLAVHQEHRRKGVAKMLVQYTLEYCKGNVTLHIKQDSPALGLFKAYGFKEDYIEMRLTR